MDIKSLPALLTLVHDHPFHRAFRRRGAVAWDYGVGPGEVLHLIP